MDSLVAMDSTNAIDSTNAKDSTVVPLERKMNSIENECAADVGSSGVVVDVESEKLNASIKSENKQKRLKSVATKGKEKKVEKGVKEKQNVKFEDLDGEVGGLNLGDAVDEVQGSKSVVYGKLHNRLSPSSVVNGAMDSKLDT